MTGNRETLPVATTAAGEGTVEGDPPGYTERVDRTSGETPRADQEPPSQAGADLPPKEIPREPQATPATNHQGDNGSDQPIPMQETAMAVTQEDRTAGEMTQEEPRRAQVMIDPEIVETI